MKRALVLCLIMALSVPALTGCGDEELPGPGAPGGGAAVDLEPHVLVLSTDEVAIGETIHVAGRNFLDLHDGRTELMFEGVYVGVGSAPEETSFTVTPLYDGQKYGDGIVNGVQVSDGDDLLRISRFGPFQVPFTPGGGKLGTFKGKLVARNIMADGTIITDDNPPTVSIDIRRSIIIRTFEPFLGFDANGDVKMAECGAPAIRAIHKLPYHIEVEAVGFEPEFWKYEISGINGSDQVIQYTHNAQGSLDQVGSPYVTDPDPVIFNPVPDDASFYVAGIRIKATVKGTDEFVETAFPMTVHRPLEFRLASGPEQVAQIYDATPVSGCIPGGIQTNVTYSETVSEARQRGVSVAIGQSWNTSHSNSASSNWSHGVSESQTFSQSQAMSEMHSESENMSETYGMTTLSTDSNSINFASSDGENWGWNMSEGQSNQDMQSATGTVYGEVSTAVSTEVSAEGSIPGVAKVGGKVGTEVGVSVGGSVAGTLGSVTGTNSQYGSSMGGSSTQSQGFGSVTTESKGESLSNSYALTTVNSLSNTTTQSEASTNSKTYNFGEGVSETVLVGEAASETWTETWVDTESISKSWSTSYKIPMGKHGVWYRQTTRTVRRGQVYTYDLCGVRELMGEMYFSNWNWAPGLALGDECDGAVMPRPDNMPAAQCVVPPCD
jgi:hypothetical protein